MAEILPTERVLGDNHPVYAGAIYLADGEPYMSPTDGRVSDLKRRFGYAEIRRCEVADRNIAAGNFAAGNFGKEAPSD